MFARSCQNNSFRDRKDRPGKVTRAAVCGPLRHRARLFTHPGRRVLCKPTLSAPERPAMIARPPGSRILQRSPPPAAMDHRCNPRFAAAFRSARLRAFILRSPVTVAPARQPCSEVARCDAEHRGAPRQRGKPLVACRLGAVAPRERGSHCASEGPGQGHARSRRAGAGSHRHWASMRVRGFVTDLGHAGCSTPFDSIATGSPALNWESRENAGDVRMPEERSADAGGQAHQQVSGLVACRLQTRSPEPHMPVPSARSPFASSTSRAPCSETAQSSTRACAWKKIRLLKGEESHPEASRCALATQVER
jgi:hypothetical protein